MPIDSKLLARYISHECNADENQMIKEYIKSNPAFAKALRKLERFLNLQELPSRPIEIEAKWQELQKRMILENAKTFNKNSSKHVHEFHARKFSYQFLRYAAIIIFTVSITYFFAKGFTNFSDNNNTIVDNFQTIKVNNGERQNITLADGSIVTVDAGSEFKYFLDYDNERHVFLKGEACFKVASDKQRPFFVHANHAVVRVVGTRFNVRSWNDNTEDVITVAEGKVAVSRDDLLEPEDTVMLTKDEQSTVPATGPLTHAANVDAEQYFRWMQNEIHFVDSKVGQVVAQLERWYDYHFIFQNPKLLEESISVHIRGANIEEVIRVISVVTETKVERKGNQIEFVQKVK